jgi:hypothetical protein
MNNAVTNIVRSLRAQQMSDIPAVELRDFETLSSDLVRATLHITHKNGSRNKKPVLLNAIRRKFAGKLQPFEGSFRSVAQTQFTDVVVGILDKVKPCITLAEAEKQGFAAYATNMYMDKEKNTWTLREADNGQLLVQTNFVEDAESLSALLDTYVSKSSRFSPDFTSVSSAAAQVIHAAQGGDLISYVSPKHNKLSFGFLCASSADNTQALVIAHDTGSEEYIDKRLIIEAFDPTNAPTIDVIADNAYDLASQSAVNKDLITEMLAYYRKVFARDPAYFAEFANRLRGYAFA